MSTPDITEMTIEELISEYVKKRDEKKALKADFDRATAELDDWMTQAEIALLANFTREGTESTRTASGTAYRITRTSAKVADWKQTLDYVKATDRWELIEQRVSKTAVEEFIAETEGVPPGVEIVRQHTIGVRRA